MIQCKNNNYALLTIIFIDCRVLIVGDFFNRKYVKYLPSQHVIICDNYAHRNYALTSIRDHSMYLLAQQGFNIFTRLLLIQ